MNLPRDEIAFRKKYEKLALTRQLTTVFRPGNRIYPNWRGYKLGEIVTLRVIEKCGNDKKCIPPTFNDIKLKVKISDIATANIEDLTSGDFQGSSPDVLSIQDLKEHLSYIYGQPIKQYDQEQVTKIQLEYLN